MLNRRHIGLGLILALVIGEPSAAQTPPSTSDVAAYQGLHLAAHRGDAAEIKRLITAGSNPNGRDGNGRTPLHVAAFARQHEAMRALAAGKADPKALDSQYYDCITIAAVADDLATMKVAIAIGGDAKAMTSPYQGTALIAAAHLGHEEVVRELIAASAPLDHINNLGWTALIEAVILGNGGRRHVDTTRFLVKAGARRDLADREGRTPLDHARSRGYREIESVLTGG
ncbi:MAG: ankyrin repeat domain-containing protein [Bosea sp. (in: a-proteobacteria)]